MQRFLTHASRDVGLNKTAINIYTSSAPAPVRARVDQIVVSSFDTPANEASQFVFGLTTSTGTQGASYTPHNLDPAGGNSQQLAGINHTAEPGYGNYLLRFGLNQKRGFLWRAEDFHEITLPATQFNGGGLKSVASIGSSDHNFAVYHLE